MNDLGENLLRFKKNQKYLVMDYETESLNLFQNTPWQLGYQIYHGSDLILDREEWIKWEHKFTISRDAARITHFTWEKYNQRATDATKIRDEFEKYLYDEEYIVIGANLFGFDIYVDNIYRKLLGRPADYSFLHRTVCVQVLHKAIELKVKPPKIGSPEWKSFCYRMQSFHQRGFKSSLQHLAGVNDVEYKKELHHVSSSYDSKLTKDVFDKELWKIELESI